MFLLPIRWGMGRGQWGGSSDDAQLGAIRYPIRYPAAWDGGGAARDPRSAGAGGHARETGPHQRPPVQGVTLANSKDAAAQQRERNALNGQHKKTPAN